MYLVVFRNRKRADLDPIAYEAENARMEQLALASPGFLALKAYAADDGEVVTISEWVSEDHARQWGAHAEHRIAQNNGRERYYESYTLFACPDPRIHQFNRLKDSKEIS